MKTVPEEAFAFLKELKRNNNRDWFNERKPYFKALEAEMKTFFSEVEILLNRHDDIERMKAFRIYRDIRFSKDKTPYKTYLSVVYRRRKPELRGGYYLHIQPENQSFLDVGFWRPDKKDLERVRKEWELDADEVREILRAPKFEKIWGTMIGNHLKTAPMGFDREHPNIKLINHKQWLFTHKFTDKEVLSKDFARRVDNCFKEVRPFFDYMSDVLNTDVNGVSLLED